MIFNIRNTIVAIFGMTDVCYSTSTTSNYQVQPEMELLVTCTLTWSSWQLEFSKFVRCFFL